MKHLEEAIRDAVERGRYLAREYEFYLSFEVEGRLLVEVGDVRGTDFAYPVVHMMGSCRKLTGVLDDISFWRSLAFVRGMRYADGRTLFAAFVAHRKEGGGTDAFFAALAEKHAAQEPVLG